MLASLRSRHYSSLIFCLSIFFSLAGQDKIDSAINKLSTYEHERIYLAYSKSKYVAGETIRFKAFVFAGYNLSEKSTNLYVEFLNKKSVPITQKLFPIVGGIAEGAFILPDSLPEDVYYVRAFTKRMLYLNPVSQYIKPIPIYNISSKIKLKVETSFYSMAFVEGGNLIAGKTATIAVRLYSTGRMPTAWKGYLADAEDTSKKIQTFNSIDPNVAVFNFTPEAGRRYVAVIEDQNRSSLRAALPPVEKEGVSLQVNVQPDTLDYMLDFTNTLLNSDYKLVGTINNEIVYRANFKATNSFMVHSFPVSKLPRGVLTLTLFDGLNKPVAERMCFLSPQIDSAASGFEIIHENKVMHGPEKFLLKIDSANSYNVVITDENSSNAFSRENVVSAFWLTSMFNDINNGARYFNEYSPQTSRVLDAIMISERNNEFKWDELLDDNFCQFDSVQENFLSYSVQVLYKKKPLVNETLTLMLFSADSNRQVFQAKTDKYGKFLLEGLVFEGDAKLSYQSDKKRRLQQEIQIIATPLAVQELNTFSLPPSDYVLAKEDENYRIPNEIARATAHLKIEKLKADKFKTLTDILIKAQIKSATEKLDMELTGNRFPIPGVVAYDFVNIKQPNTGGVNIYEWLNTREAFSRFTRFYVDNVEADLNWIKSIYTSDVALAKVSRNGGMKTVYIFLNRGNLAYTDPANTDIPDPKISGVTKIDTIEANYLNRRVIPVSRVVNNIIYYNSPLNNATLTGYSSVPPLMLFNDATASSDMPVDDDLIYWSALFESDKTNEIREISFYRNDSLKKYRVVIFGFKDDSTPAFPELTFK